MKYRSVIGWACAFNFTLFILFVLVNDPIYALISGLTSTGLAYYYIYLGKKRR